MCDINLEQYVDGLVEQRMRNRPPAEIRIILSQLLQEAITGKLTAGLDAVPEIQKRLTELDKQDVYNKIHEVVNHPIVKIVNVTNDEQFMPKKANSTDACFDLRAYLSNIDLKRRFFDNGLTLSVYQDSEECIYIMPHETRKISCGLKFHIPEGYVMKMYVRSSTGYRKNLMLANGTGIIDAGYRDEVYMCLHNFGKDPVEIKYADKLCQFEIQKIFDTVIEEVKEDSAFMHGDRGGGLGSSGN